MACRKPGFEVRQLLSAPERFEWEVRPASPRTFVPYTARVSGFGTAEIRQTVEDGWTRSPMLSFACSLSLIHI